MRPLDLGPPDGGDPATRRQVPAGSPRTSRGGLLAVALLAAVPFAGTLGHGFTFDDVPVVCRNRHLASLRSLPDLLTHGEWAGAGYTLRAYRPLTGATFALNRAAGGLTPWGFHLVNVLLHAAAAVCVLLLAASWGATPVAALAAAAIFAVHPIHAEAVASVVGRRDELATLFLLCMTLAHRRAAAAGGPRVALAWAAYAAAMFSKEIGVVGIALVAAQDLLLPDPAPRHRTRATLYAGYAVAIALYLGAYAHALGGFALPVVPFVDNPVAHASASVRVLTALAVLWKGVALQLAPAAQSPDWSYDSIALATSAADPRVIAAIALLAAWTAIAVRFRTRAPAIALSLVWYLAPLFPVSNVPFAIGTLFGERLLYASSVGAAVAFGMGAGALADRLRARVTIPVAAGVVVLLGALTARQAATWRDDATLFSAAVRVVPRSAKVRVKLAELALEGGRPAEAVAEARAAIAILPGIERARIVAARALRAEGRDGEALGLLREELAMTPASADALHVTGAILRDAGRVDEAAAAWQRAVSADPAHVGALTDLGAYRLLRGDPDGAEELLLAAVRADPGQASAWYDLALAREARGDRRGAREALAEFVRAAGPEDAAEVARVRATTLDLPR
ncbi:MAG TPA: DUF1736 domain-containing protein [Anaeromyxobacter sp.]